MCLGINNGITRKMVLFGKIKAPIIEVVKKNKHILSKRRPSGIDPEGRYFDVSPFYKILSHTHLPAVGCPASSPGNGPSAHRQLSGQPWDHIR